ncbi:MAG: FAD-dependent oxidoreductase [Saprospiraceae bacterium]
MDRFLTLVSVLYFLLPASGQVVNHQTYPVVIVGGGASGTMAAIACARQGTKCLLLESTPWLGGMLTAAGVSAIDGNHQLPSGLWGEFRDSIYAYYGGPDSVATGWVSNTLFEPSAGNDILQAMVRHQKQIDLVLNASITDIRRKDGRWLLNAVLEGATVQIAAQVLIDATELGDCAAMLGVPFRVGMDSKQATGETFAPEQGNSIIQDITYVMTLQDYGPEANKTIVRPSNYDPDSYRCCCSPENADPKPYIDCRQMLEYGRLPGGKIMINWPRCGNDAYLDVIDMKPAAREKAWELAKAKSLGFLYYLQTELGFRNLGLATGEFPTPDQLPMIPYYRESRRIKGLAFLTVNHLLKPYEQPEAYYRAGIAVGDYPIDHHHGERPDAPAIDFINIKVPSYNIPLGCLLPRDFPDMIVTEKSISVSNIVNGATRLQPVVMQLGQSSGILAALSVQHNQPPSEVPIRQVQQALLDQKGYLMPYIDIKPTDIHFQAIQKMGACGLLKGYGVPYQWANQTWFYPDLPVSEFEFQSGIRDYFPQLKHTYNATGAPLTIEKWIDMLPFLGISLSFERVSAEWSSLHLSPQVYPDTVVTRRILAVLSDHYLKLFSRNIDHLGHIQPN